MNRFCFFINNIKLVYKLCHFRNVSRCLMSRMSYFFVTSKEEIKINIARTRNHILIELSMSEKVGHEGHGFTQLPNFCYIVSGRVQS